MPGFFLRVGCLTLDRFQMIFVVFYAVAVSAQHHALFLNLPHRGFVLAVCYQAVDFSVAWVPNYVVEV